MWIVNLALRRPYTFIVMAIMILLATPLALVRTPTDVLPSIDIPVISVIWSYSGFSARDMAERIISVHERTLTTTVSNIEHLESQTLPGIAIVKVFLQPGANTQTAIAQTVSSAQSIVRQMPPGTTPPLVISYSASSIPVMQLGLSSSSLSEESLADIAQNFLRPQLVTVRGVQIPAPYGGRTRVISVDLDMQALMARGLTPSDMVNAVGVQNLILPTGTAKIGRTEYRVGTNASPDTVAELNRLPIRTQNGATLYLSDVAHVRDGFTPQTNVVRKDGQRGVLISILKNGDASTLQVVSALKALLPSVAATLPADLQITSLFDQSVFVKAAVQGVIHEALIAALLTAMMILLFLGNWRSTLIIAVSIPLSIFTSILVLSALGQTINIMTLGGLALAVGILVDDATVTIENIERHLGTGLREAILDGAGEIAVPALVSTLCICIVFVPMFFLTGVARYLFVPLAEAVVFAMLASYVLSRTLVPTLAMLLFRRTDPHPGGTAPAQARRASRFARIHYGFDRAFERLRAGYIVLLGMLIVRRRVAAIAFLGFCLLSTGLIFALGRDFFPNVDSGNIRLHMRAQTGIRIEETARLADQVEQVVREVVLPDQLDTIVDNLGLPSSGINLSYSNAGTIGTLDGEIMIALKEGHPPAHCYIETLRRILPQRFPGIEFFFQPSDIVTQILNFGQPAAIDVQLQGNDAVSNMAIASLLLKQIRTVPGAVDPHILQRIDEPMLTAYMDRTRMQQLNLSAQNVAQNVLISLAGTFQTTPTFWVNPQTGVQYPLTIQTPQYQIHSVGDLLRTPVAATGNLGAPYQLLANLADLRRSVDPAVVTHYNIRPVTDLYVSVDGRDLGAVASDIDALVGKARATLPRGTSITLRGQVETMRSSYFGLGAGVAMAIVLVYLLIVVNFQSWIDPLIIISAMPAALAGIAWILFVTGTHLSVPALTGAIMTVGVATANSILVVAFARQRLDAGVPALSAALEAGATRIRPVMMTALAMIIGMIPMALGLGEGAEQNAPLGRAVIGGLLFATVSTLFFVPLVFADAHHRLAKRREHRAEALCPLDSYRPVELMEDKRHSAVGLHVDESGLDLPARAQVRRRTRLALVVAVVLAALAARTLVADYLNRGRLDRLAEQNVRQYVSVVEPSPSRGDTRLALPGTLRGYVEAPIYARANGYVSRWDVDIGTRVKAGQVLAELDTPEVDQEYAQAVAQRQQVQSSLALAKTSFDRAQQLRQRDAVSQQELDDRQGTYNQAVANLSAADANVRRLTELKDFQKIVAPVDGVVTQRNIDIGDLVNAGNGGAGRALFVVTQADRLRLYVRVPQTYAQQVTLGQHVAVTQSELPSQIFDGTVTHTAQAIDVATRTLQIEITLPNADGRLLPGAYVNATLPMAAVGTLTIPANTLLFRAEGPTVAVVGADGKVALHPVQIARTLGKTLEIDTGVAAGDRIVLNPSDSLATGDVVIAKTAAPEKVAGKSAGKPASNPAASAAAAASGASTPGAGS